MGDQGEISKIVDMFSIPGSMIVQRSSRTGLHRAPQPALVSGPGQVVDGLQKRTLYFLNLTPILFALSRIVISKENDHENDHHHS